MSEIKNFTITHNATKTTEVFKGTELELYNEYLKHPEIHAVDRVSNLVECYIEITLDMLLNGDKSLSMYSEITKQLVSRKFNDSDKIVVITDKGVFDAATYSKHLTLSAMDEKPKPSARP